MEFYRKKIIKLEKNLIKTKFIQLFRQFLFKKSLNLQKHNLKFQKKLQFYRKKLLNLKKIL